MKISEIIAMLEDQLHESGDAELMIYDSSGELIQPKSFSCGAKHTELGWVDTVSFSDVE